MAGQKIELDFGAFVCGAELFATPPAARFVECLPCTISCTRWGNELYGPIGHDLGEYAPVTEIPPGGIAYSNSGTYLCIFFGQTPAWPVEHIGGISGDGWKELCREQPLSTLTVRMK